MQTFRTPQVASLTGASYRQLDHWSRTGALRASVAEARGSGSFRVYSLADVRCAAVLSRLFTGQTTPAVGRAVCAAIHWLDAEWSTASYLLVTPDGRWSVSDVPGAALADLGPVAWLIDLHAISADLADRLTMLVGDVEEVAGCSA